MAVLSIDAGPVGVDQEHRCQFDIQPVDPVNGVPPNVVDVPRPSSEARRVRS